MHVTEGIHWPRTALPAPETHVIDGETKADVLVVGAGLTGCRTALGLAQAGVSVAVVDARHVGFGASGRSGGQCNPMWRQTPDELRKMFGADQGDRLIQTTLDAANALFRDIARFKIACDPVQAGWIQAAHTKTTRRRLQALGASWQAEGANITELRDHSVREATGSLAYRFALHHGTGGHVHPLSLTRGYATAAITQGARIYESAPVRSLKRIGTTWHAKTPRGTVVADTVVLTTNAYSTDIWPGLRQSFHPLVSISLATEPLSDNQRASVLPGQVTLSDTRYAIYYCRYDRDGRLIFGCVGSNDSAKTLGGVARLQRGLRTVFPQIADIGIERTWAGRIAVTPGMMPHLHAPAPGILAGLGFSGRGIAMTSVMGRTLSAKVLGTPDSDLPFPISPIKPIPFHGLSRTVIPLAAPALTLKDRLDVMLDGT